MRFNQRLASFAILSFALGTGAGLAAPANDNFANAILLAGENGNQTGLTNAAATFEPNEPVCVYPGTTNTVWFKWVCTQAGSLTISTSGSTDAGDNEWDSVVCAYTGASLDALTLVKSSDEEIDEIVNIAVSPGTYYFQMGGYSPPSPGVVAANIALNWSFAAVSFVDVSNDLGPLQDGGLTIDNIVGAGNTGRLTGYATTYWNSNGFTVPVDLNGNTLEVNSGGGNEPYRAHGSISGSGNLVFDTVLNHRITVDAENTYSGNTLIRRGWVQMGVTDGQTNLLGTITVGGTSAGKLGWGANDQIDDASDISLGAGGSTLDLGGYTEQINDLYLISGSSVTTGAGGVLKVANLYIDGVPQPETAYVPGDGFVTGSGYIEVGASGPPVIGDAPDEPSTPAPADLTDTIHPATFTKLDWADSIGAASYDVYFWTSGETKPASPTTNVLLSEYTPPFGVESLETYHWQIVAINQIGETAGPEWSFSTVARGDVSGIIEDPNTWIGVGNTANLIGDTAFTWKTGDCAIPAKLNEFTLTLDSGGGNAYNYTGTILSGTGGLILKMAKFTDTRGYWDSVMHIGGDEGNNYAGPTVVAFGLVSMEKTSGNAFNGTVTVGGNGQAARLIWQNDNQIADESDLQMPYIDVVAAGFDAGRGSYLNLNGFSDTIGNLSIETGTYIDTGDGGVLTVASMKVDGVPIAPGSYNNSSAFVSGSGTIEVIGGGAMTYDDWKAIHAGGQAATMDYDNDGVSNGVEYFMDAPDGFTANPGIVEGKITWPRGNPVAFFEVQVSDNLSDWAPADSEDVDLSNPGQVTFTMPVAESKNFCRLLVVP